MPNTETELSPLPAGMTGRQIAIADDYAGLIAALRRRKNELDFSDATVDELANLAVGATGKLLGAALVKKFGMLSLFAMCFALGVKVALVEDPEAMEVIAQSGNKRKRPPYPHRRACALGETTLRRVRPAVLSELGKLGAKARNAKLSATRKSEIGRTASLARWKKRREARAAKPQAATP